jgi:SAM-dependent methyltransferase
VSRSSSSPAVSGARRRDRRASVRERPDAGSSVGTAPPCRFCRTPLRLTFVDLGLSPIANAYLSAAELGRGETFYPLRPYVCEECLLVQLEEFEGPEALFRDYAYYSSYSDTWLRHAEKYVEATVARFELGRDHRVIEIASNDGYLLQYLVERGIPVLGIEPARNVAEAAAERGIPTLIRFFGATLAAELSAEGRRADLLVANNVLAHVPDLNDFVQGMKLVLEPRGVVTVEFPHLMRLMEENQFDTIYHEHFSYFSFLTVEKIFRAHGLTPFDVEELPTHGGSLRIYARHAEDTSRAVSPRVRELRRRETERRMDRVEGYLSFDQQVQRTKLRLLTFLIEAREAGKSVVGYGAPAKGNTLLNYCGVRADLIDYTVDRSPHKQGRYLPGTRIPIHAPDRIRETRPDYVLILPWNLKEEIMDQIGYVREWGGQFAIPIPELHLHG